MLPPVRYRVSLPATKLPISPCASWVEPPTWGVRITLSSPRSADSNGSPCALGSTGNTSRAAPAMWPERMFSRSARSSTTMPREALMNIERGFIRANCSAPNRPAFPGRPSTCRVTTSASSRSWSRLATARALPWASRSAVSKKITRKPSASATLPSWVPMLPYPTMPSVRPRTSWLPWADLSQTPACIFWVFSGRRRARAMISPMTSSTTLRVLEYGALNAATPRSAAAGRSIWLVPMQNAPTARRSGALPSTFSVTLVLERTPSSVLPWTASMSSSSDSACERVCTTYPWRSKTSFAAGWMFSRRRTSGVAVTDQAYEAGRFTGLPHPRCGRRSPARRGSAAGSGRSRRRPCRG